MNEWVEKFLTEISTLNYGDNLPSSELKSSGYKVFGANGFIGFNDKYNLEQATVLISCRGEYSGTINLVPAKTFVTNNSIPVVLKNGETDTTFLFYKLQTLRKEHIVSGSAQPQVTINDLKKVKLKVPVDIDEQRKIARILSTADAVIEKTRAAIAKYKAVKQGMLHDLFTRGIDPHTGTPRPKPEDAPELYRDSPLGKVPKAWDVKRIENVSSLVTNGFVGIATPFYTTADKGVPYLYGTNVREDFIDFKDLRYISREFHNSHIKSQLKAGDMLCVQSGHIGVCAVVPEQFVEANCHALIITRFHKEQIYSDFISFYLNSPLGKQQLDKIIIGSTIKHINTSELAKHQIPIPLVEEQKEIAKRLRMIDANIQTEQNYLAKLQSIKAGLMADLLSGRKPVTVDESAPAVTEYA